jgi:hypothetical protein
MEEQKNRMNMNEEMNENNAAELCERVPSDNDAIDKNIIKMNHVGDDNATPKALTDDDTKSMKEDATISPSNEEDQAFSCMICLEIMFTPTTLGCGHSGCIGCFEKYFKVCKYKISTCPKCREPIKRSKHMQINFTLRDLASIRYPDLLKEICEDATVERTKTYGTAIYTGQFVNEKRQGFGKFTLKGGDYYEGEWFNDKQHGEGKFRWKKKSIERKSKVYEGQFVDGFRTGQGKLTYSDTRYYEGGFKKNARHGEGTLHYVNGNVERGEWIDGRIKSGIVQYEDGHHEEGHWTHCMNTTTSKTGTSGPTKCVRFLNYGTKTYPCGKILSGEWLDSEGILGQGQLKLPNGEIKEGKWKDILIEPTTAK